MFLPQKTQLIGDQMAWLKFDTDFGNFSRYESMIDVIKMLQTFAETVYDKDSEYSVLKEQFEQFYQIKPESIKSLIKLSQTEELLLNEHVLRADERDAIVYEVLNVRKTLAQEIVAEGNKCSLTIAYSQFANLYTAWKEIQSGNLTIHSGKQELSAIEKLIEQTIEICVEAKKLMTKYTECTNSAKRKEILEQLVKKSSLIRNGYRECLTKMEKLQFEIANKTLTLHFTDFEQKEALKLNAKRTIKKTTLNIWQNKLLLVKPLLFAAATGANYVVSKKLVKESKKNLMEIMEKLKELEILVQQIENENHKVSLFLESNRLSVEDFDSEDDMR